MSNGPHYVRTDIFDAVERAVVHFLERLSVRRARLLETLERKQAMDDYAAYHYDVLRRFIDAMDAITQASHSIQHDEPPWTGCEESITTALKALHVARVDLAAARVAYAKAVHRATVATNPRSDEASGTDT